MEEKPLPPVSSISSEDESNALDVADANAPVSSYTLAPKTYPIETLEVRNEGEASTAKVISSNVHAMAFSRRRALIISLTITMLVVVLTGIAVAFLVRSNTADDSRLERDIPTQGVTIDAPLPEANAIDTEVQEGSLLVSGDIVSSGTIRVANDAFASIISTETLSGNQTFTLPNASGTICLDSNNCNFATEADQAALQAQIAQLGVQVGQITIPETPEPFDGVTALNGQNGTLSIQGTTNRISIVTTNGVLRFTTPQDIAVTSSPTFSSLLLTGGMAIGGSVTLPLDCTTYAAGGVLTTNAGGQVVCADDDNGGSGGVTTSGGTPGAIPLFTGTQTIGDSVLSQSGTTVNVGGTLTLSNALGVASGGTGLSTTPTNGQLLIGNGTGYNLAALTQGSGITITNGSGSILIASTLGTDIATGEIVDNTILAIDLSSTNNPIAGQILTYDSSGGFTWEDAANIVGSKVEAINALTGSISLQGTVGEITVTDNGTDTITLDLHTNVSLLGQSIGSGEIESNAVQLSAQTTGDYVANIGALTGLSATGNSGESSTPTLAVLYGSTANTAVQGNTTLQCANGIGNLTGGGNTLTLGAGGGCNTIATVQNPTFTTSVTTPYLLSTGGLNIDSGVGIDILSTTDTAITAGTEIRLSAMGGTIELQSATNITGSASVSNVLGVGQGITIGTGVTAGSLAIYDGSSNGGTLQVTNLTTDRTYTLPDADGTVCLTSGNCIGGGSGSAPANASFLTLSTDSNLTNERSLALGSNLTATDGGANSNYTISIVSNPTFASTVTSPQLQGNGGLNLRSDGGGSYSQIDLAENSIELNAALGTIELQSNTNVAGNIDITGLTSVGNTASANSRHIFSASHTFGSGNACNLGICSGVDSVVTLGSAVVSPGILAAFSGATYADTGAILPNAYGVLINTGGGPGTIQTNTGIYIANQTAGTVSNYGLHIAGASTYALYVETGASLLKGALTVEGTTSIGTTGSAGTLRIYDGTSDAGIIQIANLNTNRTYTFPNADGTVCLTSGNCIGGASGSAPANASYLMIAADPNLTSERSLTLGSNLTATDGGANSSYSINTVTNPTFTNVRTPIVSNTSSISIAATTSLGLTSSSSSSITLTSANQIVLNSIGTIELQDDTNITGSLAVDGNTLNVNATSNTVGIGVAAASQEILKLQSSSTKLEVYSAGDNDFELASDGAVYISIDNDNNDASDDASPAFNIVANGDYGNPILWVSQNGDIETTGSIFIEDFLTLGVSNVTVSDNGAGTPAAHVLDPTSTYVEITCNDAEGCDVTMEEVTAVEGYVVIIMNIGTNSVNLADSSGVHELAGNFIGGQWDTLSILYGGDRWIETSRSDN